MHSAMAPSNSACSPARVTPAVARLLIRFARKSSLFTTSTLPARTASRSRREHSTALPDPISTTAARCIEVLLELAYRTGRNSRDGPQFQGETSDMANGDLMINLTRLSHERLVLNSDLIEYMETTPDTVITLTTGQKLRVSETADEVIARVIAFRRAVFERSRRRPMLIEADK